MHSEKHCLCLHTEYKFIFKTNNSAVITLLGKLFRGLTDLTVKEYSRYHGILADELWLLYRGPYYTTSGH